MGAELYIPEIHVKSAKKYTKLVAKALRERNSFEKGSKQWAAAQRRMRRYSELRWADGYFCDPYNSLGVLHRMGLSWWRDVASKLRRDEELKLSDVRAFRDAVATHNLKLPT